VCVWWSVCVCGGVCVCVVECVCVWWSVTGDDWKNGCLESLSLESVGQESLFLRSLLDFSVIR